MPSDDTLYIYPKDENNCSKFIVCHHNEKYELSCLQASLFLFTDERLCLADCNIESTTTTVNKGVSRNSYEFNLDYLLFPDEGTPSKTILCPPTGNTLAFIPQNCKEFIECQDGIGTRQKCDEEMEFSPFKYQCIPKNSSECSTKKIKGSPNSKCRFEKGVSSSTFLPSEKCSEFKKCAISASWTITCARGTFFNKETKSCDWKENVKCSE